jgi:peptide/nickel transport system permease protein
VRSLPVYLALRLLSMAAVVVAVAIITFLMLHLLRPESFGDPRSLPVELGDYLASVFLHYDFGVSRGQGARPVADLLNAGLPADVSLLAGGLLLGAVGGTAAGAVCVAHPRTLRARVLAGLGAFTLCAPLYWVGLMVVLAFDSGFGFVVEVPGFSTHNYVGLTEDPLQWAGALLVPWLVLGMPVFGLCLRMTRAALAEVLDEDYVRSARAKGLPDRVVMRRHAFPAAASPVMTLVGVNMATVVTNLVLVERVFSVPGVFGETTVAMDNGDFELLMGMTIWAAVFIVAANFVVDLLQARVDPLVRVK